MGMRRRVPNAGRCLLLPLLGALALTGCGLSAIEDAREEARAVAQERCGGARGPVRPRLRDGAPCGPALRGPGADRRGSAGHAARSAFLTVDAVTLPLAGAHDEAVLATRIEAATGLARALRRHRPRRCGYFVGHRGPDGAERRRLDRPARPAAGRLDRGRGPRVALQRRCRPHRDRAAAHRCVPGQRAGRHRTPRRLVVDAGPGRRGRLRQPVSAQSIESETVYDPWPEIEAQLAGLVGEETVVTVSPASASVTVSGAPADVRRVRGYLGWLNREVLRPVTLRVHLYAVSFERETDHGVDLSLSEMLGSSVGLAVAGDTLSLVRPSGAEDAGDTLAAAVRALSRAGTVSRVLSADIPSTERQARAVPGTHQGGLSQGAQDHGRRGGCADRAGAGDGVVGVRALLSRAHHRTRRGAGEALGESQGPSAIHHLQHGRPHHPAPGLRRTRGAGHAGESGAARP